MTDKRYKQVAERARRAVDGLTENEHGPSTRDLLTLIGISAEAETAPSRSAEWDELDAYTTVILGYYGVTLEHERAGG